jgi:hypothetical protein
VIGRRVGVVKVEEGRSGALRIAVEEDRFLTALTWDAADQGMLPALAEALEIREGPVRLGHRRVVFLDARPHLGDQFLAQALRIGQHGGAVGVFTLEMVADRLRQDVWIAQHLLPVLGLEPRVVVPQLNAVNLRLARLNLRHRWLVHGRLHRGSADHRTVAGGRRRSSGMRERLQRGGQG